MKQGVLFPDDASAKRRAPTVPLETEAREKLLELMAAAIVATYQNQHAKKNNDEQPATHKDHRATSTA